MSTDFTTYFFPPNLPDFGSRYGYAGFPSAQTEEETNSLLVQQDGEIVGKFPASMSSLDERILHMDENNVSKQILTPIPFLFSYWAKGDDTADLCRIVNNAISSSLEAYSKTNATDQSSSSNGPSSRFSFFAIVSLQAPELAVREIRRVMKLPNCVGIAIGTHVNDWNLDAPELAPIWETCEELSCLISVHAYDLPCSRKDRKYMLPNLIGKAHEINRSLTTMLLGGVLDRWPKLKFLFSNGGGSFPFLVDRVQMGYESHPEKCAWNSEQGPKDFLGKFWVDSNVSSLESLNFLSKTIGEEKVVLGSGYPELLDENGNEIKHKGVVYQLEEDKKNKILDSNASLFLQK
eukprot:maker-scaffold_54-snap-gene-1.16-mRNA-1 protein AED:0.00 eAED:0.00 QI:162/1/1/1/1/1/2/134/347